MNSSERRGGEDDCIFVALRGLGSGYRSGRLLVGILARGAIEFVSSFVVLVVNVVVVAAAWFLWKEVLRSGVLVSWN